MILKFIFLISIFTVSLTTVGQIKQIIRFVNPTGSYKLDGKIRIKDGDTFGCFGDIDVKLIDSSKIAISFFICKGAPSYNLGSFLDTLAYQQNVAIYTTPEYDSTCRVIFSFREKGVTVEQFQADLNFGCGFGHGVFADGYYKKVSSKIPVIADIEDKYNGTNGILQKY